MEKKHLLEQDNFVTYENFASMLAKKEKKTVKKVSVKEVKEEHEQVSMERMKYYNHNAKEIYFYTTMSTTDIKG